MLASPGWYRKTAGMRVFAVVGSGPSGLYATEAIAKALPDAEVHVFDRLPTPYGLVRSGVAPDHQGTKNVWRVYQRTLQRANVHYFGNIEIGRDLSLDDLREHYDAVFLAVGAPVDKALGVPGEDKVGVIGSSQMSGWYNGHPDFSSSSPDLGQGHIAVIGNGNVAVDVVRVLARAADEMLKTDLPAYAREQIARAPITDIHMIGRRGPGEASFTPVELRELGELSRCVAVVDKTQLPESIVASDPNQQKLKDKILDILRGYSNNDAASKPLRLHIHFYAAPREIAGNVRVQELVLDRTRVENGQAVFTGETFVIPATLVIKAIGFHIRPLAGVPGTVRDICYPNEHGKIADGLFAVGWAKRGPSGVIATNRQDSIEVVERMLKELESYPSKGDGARVRIETLLQARNVKRTSFADWEKIETAENQRALAEGYGAARVKVTEWSELLALATV